MEAVEVTETVGVELCVTDADDDTVEVGVVVKEFDCDDDTVLLCVLVGVLETDVVAVVVISPSGSTGNVTPWCTNEKRASFARISSM